MTQPTSSLPGSLRIGPLLAIPALLREAGVSPDLVFHEAGVSRSAFADADRRIPYERLGCLLEACARHTGCAHFGLLVGERFNLAGLGDIGELMRHCPTVGDALRALTLHLHLHDRGAVPVLLEVSETFSLLSYCLCHYDSTVTAPIHDVALTIGQRILRQLCGPGWTAYGVQFSRPRPASVRAHQRVFGCKLRFDAEMPGLLFENRWLQQAIRGAAPSAHARLAAQLGAAHCGMRLSEQVERILQSLIPGGHASAAAVSRLLGLSERTLRRRLEAEGRTLRGLVNQVRFDSARQLLRDTRLPVSAIAAFLQYEDANAFIRAFTGWAGSSPLQWRLKLIRKTRPAGSALA